MKRAIYTIIHIILLLILAISFVFQVKAFGTEDPFQWYALIIIGIVGLTSYLTGKQMKKEPWFGKPLRKRKLL